MSVTGPSGRVRARWAYWSLVPLGLGAWAPIYAGVRGRNALWALLGVLCTLATIAGWILAVHSNGKSGAGGLLLIAGWVGAVAASFMIRPAYVRELTSPFEAAQLSARERLAERRRGQELARTRPELAREIGVGRPDLPGARPAGVVDVNNAPASALTTLPDVDDALATRIVEVRSEVRGFSSLEDLGTVLDLDPDVVESLRDRVVFLPRQ